MALEPRISDLAQKALAIYQRLIDFYGQPLWRNPVPAVDELVSTILSQNTNDRNRDQAYETLRRRLPTWEGVRDADPAVVIDAVRSAGLANQKGPRIQAVLRELSTERGSFDLDFLRAWPREKALTWLKEFKGVGPKTAAIVLQFALGVPALPVDTHVYRVSGRLGLRPEKMSVEMTHGHLETLLPPETYYTAHINLIRLGREICHARKPDCPTCPLSCLCDYYHNQESDRSPEKSANL